MDELREECGVFGVYASKEQNLASMTYYGLYALQHRGQDSCGIVVNDGGVFTAKKELGLVGDVFTKEKLLSFGDGKIAIGHVRAGTKGTINIANAQPLVVNHIKGSLALGFNGSLVNKTELKTKLELQGSIFQSNGDAEVIAYEIIKERLHAPSIEQAVVGAMNKLDGAYCIVVMSPTKLIAARDKFGFRPLCYGKTQDGSYVVASESCALDAVGAKLIRDVMPGEVVVFDSMGVRSITEHCDKKKMSLCVFEFVYNARPDSVVDGIPVHEARVEMGRYLAKRFPVEADVVISVPDSGNDAAIGYAKESGIPYELGFLKNKYVGRTFIFPEQKDREDQVRKKLNPIASVVRGKRVVMVDDSIVRGTTSGRVVSLLREAGATEVHFMVSSPPFLFPCYYGTDVPNKNMLIANMHTEEEIRKMIGVDSLHYLKLEDMKELSNDKISFCYSCFDGKYPTQIPAEQTDKYQTKIDIEQKTKRH